MFWVNRAEDAIMRESQELMTEASMEAMNSPIIPGPMVGKRS